MLNEYVVDVKEIETGKITAEAMRALAHSYGSPFGKRKATNPTQETAASQMAAKFAANSLVVAEPRIFGATVESLVQTVQKIDPRAETIKSAVAHDIVRQFPTPFGATVEKIAGIA